MFIAKDGFGFEANNFGVGRGLIVFLIVSDRILKLSKNLK